MATQKDFNNSDEQIEECKPRNISCRKVVPNFSSDDEVELIAPSPVFMKFSRPQRKDKNGSKNEVYPSTKELLGARSDAANHEKEVAFYSIQKPNLQLDDSFCGSISDSTLPKVNPNDDFDRSKCHRKKKNLIKPSEAGVDPFPDSSLMDKARKYSQKISNKLREEKKAIAKQYFHELLHSCDGGSDEDVEFANSGQKQIYRKKRKAEIANSISPCPGKERKEESRVQEKKRHKKKRSKVSPRSCLNGRDLTPETQSSEQGWSCDVLGSVPNNERHDYITSSSGGRISRENNVLRNMVSMDSVDGMQEKPQRRCRQNLCMNIPKELQWPSASESETEEDNTDVSLVCSLRHPKPNYSPSCSYMEDETSMQLKRKSATCNDSSPRIRRFSSRQCQNLNVVDQNTNSYIPEQMWLYNSANISEGATAIHSVPVRNSSVDAKKTTNTREKGHSQQNKQETNQQSKADLKGVTVISISDDESGSDLIEEESVDGNIRERYPMRRSQRFSDRQDRGWSVPERLESEVLPSPSFLHPSQNPLLAARLTSQDNAGPRTSTRSSVKGRPLRPNRNCRQRHEVQSSPRSQRMFQTVAQMDGDEEMARRLQEEMDFEYAMTLHNAEAQVQPPPCHRLPEYHTHDSDSPTTMLTRGMRQATRDMDIVLETLFHEESGESSNENSMMEFSFAPSLMISHNVNRRGNRNRGRRHDWTERLLQDELHQGRNHLPRRIFSQNRTFSSNDYEDLLSIAELLGDVKPKGISSEEVTLLPEKKFHPNNKMTSCSICMSDYILNERLKILPCFHEFHGECIEKWIVTNATCPICRVEVKV